MDPRPNVVVLVFDTLRSDYLGCYGSGLDTAAFDRIASEGTLFESAFGTAPGTPISHASLYTGQYPSEHGVTGQYIDLPEDVPVMASWFRDAGYDTFGITGPSKMGSDWGYDRGFEELYEHYYDLPAPTSWRNVTRSLVDPRFRRYFLRQITRGGREKTRYKFELLRDRIDDDLGRPFFALSNVATVHSPYDPPRPYKRRATPGYSRPSLFFLEYLFDDHGSIDDPEIRLDRVMDVQFADGIGRYLSDPGYLNDKEIQLLRAWYGACVEYLDDELARFLEFYDRELRENTVLVLTSDHGEQLGEHGLWGHSHGLYDETLRIPQIVAGPGVPENERRSDPVSQVDVFDTLCRLCGLERPGTTSGIDLFGGDQRDAVFMEYGARDTEAFSETAHGRYLDREALGRFCAGRKAIRTPSYRYEVTSLGTEHLFELPEQVELDDEDQPGDVRARLRERLRERLGDEFGVWPESKVEEMRMDERVEQNLRELGYIE